jgi:large subunit ribosomal protein L16
MQRKAGKTAQVWIRIFPDRPITKKAAEVPMGKGKGNPEAFCFEVRPGRILFEIDGVDEATAREALRKAGTKLPVKTKIVARAI